MRPESELAALAAARGEIENLIARYAQLIDTGDFDGVGELLAGATFIGSGEPVSGPEAIASMYREMLWLYDGLPATKHVTTNLLIEADLPAGTATAESYFTVHQSLPDFPLQVIVSGRYRDRFRRADGAWSFSERRVLIDAVGDTSRHLRPR